MALPPHIRIGDKITEHDPFPFRWLKKLGVTSRKTAEVITIIGIGIAGVFMFVMFSISVQSTTAPVGEPLPAEEMLLLEETADLPVE